MSSDTNGANAVDFSSQVSDFSENQELGGEAVVEEAKEELEELESKANPTKEEKKKISSLRIKVNGKEYEEQLGFEIDDDPKAREYLTRQLQLARNGQRVAQEHSEFTKEVEDWIQLLKTNPRAALADPTIGIDLKRLAAEIIEDDIEQSRLTPEQKKIREYEEKIAKIEKENEDRENEYKSKRQIAEEKSAFDRYDTMITEAISKTDLPKSNYVVKKIADAMLSYIEAEGSEPNLSEIMPSVRQEIYDDMKAMAASFSPEDFEKFLGKEFFENKRKKNLSDAKVAKPKPQTLNSQLKDVSKPMGQKAPEAEKKSFKEFFGV